MALSRGAARVQMQRLAASGTRCSTEASSSHTSSSGKKRWSAGVGEAMANAAPRVTRKRGRSSTASTARQMAGAGSGPARVPRGWLYASQARW